jgi:Uma2 family endonuclease
MALTKWTIDDLETLPEPWDDTRYEIIDGELYVTRQPDYFHQRLSARLTAAIEWWSDQTAAGETSVAPGVIFAPDEAVAPDVVWISAQRVRAVVGPDRKIHAAPDLVIEILSPGHANEQRDRDVKLGVYSRRGVNEYWIVDWRLRQIEVYRRLKLELRLVATLLEEDTLESPLLPGFALPLRKLFADIPAE